MILIRWLRAIAAELLSKLDLPLLVALLAVMASSLVVLSSASGGERLVLSQAARFAAGLAGLVLLSRVPPVRLKRWAPAFFAVTLVLLLLVFPFGSGRSANLWLNLGVFHLQPGELLKLSVPMLLAWYLHRIALPPGWSALAICAVIIGLPFALITLQPDLGTALLVAAAGAFAVFLSGIAWWRIGLFAAAGVAALPIAWQFLMPYQQARVFMFLDPESDPRGSGWNIIQSKIAIGSGGWSGKGWGKGSQSHLDFLPESTTDFVFSVLSEEWGLLGVLLVLGLYLFIIGRSLWIAANARDCFARLLAGSLAMTFSIYVLVNGGMVAGLLPVVGVPMPLLSFGGTSAVSLLLGFGIIMSVQAHRKVHGSG
ncbi:MAG TPA: rod shape-determining protein RodA [Arenimonas sp.]|nr:rod shape-determining protein RodA [Arenimonas sp.]